MVVCFFLSQSAFVVFHTRLERSEPAADTTVQSAPAAIRLFFSAPVQVNVTTVRLTGPDSQLIETAPPRLGEGAKPPVIADLRGSLPPGRFAVAWRTMSRDGHVVRGTFSFTVATRTSFRPH